MDRDEIIRQVYLLDMDQLVLLKQLLDRLGCRKENQKRDKAPDPQDYESVK